MYEIVSSCILTKESVLVSEDSQTCYINRVSSHVSTSREVSNAKLVISKLFCLIILPNFSWCTRWTTSPKMYDLWGCWCFSQLVNVWFVTRFRYFRAKKNSLALGIDDGYQNLSHLLLNMALFGGSMYSRMTLPKDLFHSSTVHFMKQQTLAYRKPFYHLQSIFHTTNQLMLQKCCATWDVWNSVNDGIN